MQGVWVDSHVSQGPEVLLSRQDDKDKETQKERQQVDVLGEDGIGVQDLCQDEVEMREKERRASVGLSIIQAPSLGELEHPHK